MHNIHRKIKSIRNHVNKTQGEFAAELNVSRSNIALIETGKTPPAYELLKNIVDRYSIKPDFFFNSYTDYGDFLNENNRNVTPEIDETLITEWINRDRKNPYYSPTRELSIKLYSQHKHDIENFLAAMNTYWEQQMSFMQFIQQYDRFFIDSIHFEMFKIANDEMFDKEELANYFTSLFRNYKSVSAIVIRLNKFTADYLIKLKPFDIHNRLYEDYWKVALKAEMSGDYETGAVFYTMFDLLRKIYRERPHDFLK